MKQGPQKAAKKVQIQELDTEQGRRLHEVRQDLKGGRAAPKRADAETPLKRFNRKNAQVQQGNHQENKQGFGFSKLNNKWVMGGAITLVLSAASLGTGVAAITPLHAVLTTVISGLMVGCVYLAGKSAMAIGHRAAANRQAVASNLSSTLHTVRATVSNSAHTAYDYTFGASAKFVGSLFHRHQATQKKQPTMRSCADAGIDATNIIEGPRTRSCAKQ